MMVLTGESELHQEKEDWENTILTSLIDLLGVNKLPDFEAADAPIKPDFYVNSLGDLKVLAE